jgi:hypothetical protein
MWVVSFKLRPLHPQGQNTGTQLERGLGPSQSQSGQIVGNRQSKMGGPARLHELNYPSSLQHSYYFRTQWHMWRLASRRSSGARRSYMFSFIKLDAPHHNHFSRQVLIFCVTLSLLPANINELSVIVAYRNRRLPSQPVSRRTSRGHCAIVSRVTEALDDAEGCI